MSNNPGYGNQPQWPGQNQPPWPPQGQPPFGQQPPPGQGPYGPQPQSGPPLGPPPGGQPYGPPRGQGQSLWSGYPSGSVPPKKKTGLIVGIIVGAVVLIGVSIGGALLLTGKDSKASKDDKKTSRSSSADPRKITDACKLFTASELSAKTGIQGIQTISSKPTPLESGKGTKIKCTYDSSAGGFGSFSLLIYDGQDCVPAQCIQEVNRPGQQPISGVGKAAVYYVSQSGATMVNVLEAADEIGGHTVYLTVTSAQQGATANVLGPIGKDIFAAAEKQST